MGNSGTTLSHMFLLNCPQFPRVSGAVLLYEVGAMVEILSGALSRRLQPD